MKKWPFCSLGTKFGREYSKAKASWYYWHFSWQGKFFNVILKQVYVIVGSSSLLRSEEKEILVSSPGKGIAAIIRVRRWTGYLIYTVELTCGTYNYIL